MYNSPTQRSDPIKQIATNFGVMGVLADNINYAKLGVGILKGFRLMAEGSILAFPIGWYVVLITVLALSRCRGYYGTPQSSQSAVLFSLNSNFVNKPVFLG